MPKKHLKLQQKQPPNVEGNWKVIEKQVTQDKLICNPRVFKYEAKFIQKGKFVQSVASAPDRKPMLGVWQRLFDKKLKFSGWQLIVVDSNNDNDTFLFRVTDLCKHNIALRMENVSFESGFSPGNPDQVPNVAVSFWKRIYK